MVSSRLGGRPWLNIGANQDAYDGHFSIYNLLSPSGEYGYWKTNWNKVSASLRKADTPWPQEGVWTFAQYGRQCEWICFGIPEYGSAVQQLESDYDAKDPLTQYWIRQKECASKVATRRSREDAANGGRKGRFIVGTASAGAADASATAAALECARLERNARGWGLAQRLLPKQGGAASAKRKADANCKPLLDMVHRDAKRQKWKLKPTIAKAARYKKAALEASAKAIIPANFCGKDLADVSKGDLATFILNLAETLGCRQELQANFGAALLSKDGEPSFGGKNGLELMYRSNLTMAKMRPLLSGIKAVLPTSERGAVTDTAGMRAAAATMPVPAFVDFPDEGGPNCSDAVAVVVLDIAVQLYESDDPHLQFMLGKGAEKFGATTVLTNTIDGVQMTKLKGLTHATMQIKNLVGKERSPLAMPATAATGKPESAEGIRQLTSAQYIRMGKAMKWRCPGKHVCHLASKGGCGQSVVHEQPVVNIKVNDNKAAKLETGVHPSYCVHCPKRIRGEEEPAGTEATVTAVDVPAPQATYTGVSLGSLRAQLLQRLTAAGKVVDKARHSRRARVDVINALEHLDRTAIASGPVDSEMTTTTTTTTTTTAAAAATPPARDISTMTMPDIFEQSAQDYDKTCADFVQRGGTSEAFFASPEYDQWRVRWPNMKYRSTFDARFRNITLLHFDCTLHCYMSIYKQFIVKVLLPEVGRMMAAGYGGFSMWLEALRGPLGKPGIALKLENLFKEAGFALIEVDNSKADVSDSIKVQHPSKLCAVYVNQLLTKDLVQELQDLISIGSLPSSMNPKQIKKMSLLEKQAAVIKGLQSAMGVGTVRADVLAQAAAQKKSRFSNAANHEAQLKDVLKVGDRYEMMVADPGALNDILQSSVDALMGDDIKTFAAKKGSILQCFNANAYNKGILMSALNAAVSKNVEKGRAVADRRAALEKEREAAEGMATADADADDFAALAGHITALEEEEAAIALEEGKLSRDHLLVTNAPLDERSKRLGKVFDALNDVMVPFMSGQSRLQLTGTRHTELWMAYEGAFAGVVGKPPTGDYSHHMREHTQGQINYLEANLNGALTVASMTSQGPEHKGKMWKGKLGDLYGVQAGKKMNIFKYVMAFWMRQFFYFNSTIPKRGVCICGACGKVGHRKDNLHFHPKE